MATRLQSQLKLISKALGVLTKKVEKCSAQVAKMEGKKTAPARKPTVRKKAAQRAAAGKTARKPASKAKRKDAKKASVLDSVYNVIKRSRKGMSIASIKKATGLESRQLSNALYKLAKRGSVVTQARGVYVKK